MKLIPTIRIKDAPFPWGISYYLVSALPHRHLPCKLGMSAQLAIAMKIRDVCAEFHLSWIVRACVTHASVCSPSGNIQNCSPAFPPWTEEWTPQIYIHTYAYIVFITYDCMYTFLRWPTRTPNWVLGSINNLCVIHAMTCESSVNHAIFNTPSQLPISRMWVSRLSKVFKLHFPLPFEGKRNYY